MGTGHRVLLHPHPLRAVFEGCYRYQRPRVLSLGDLPRSLHDRAVARISQVEGIMAAEWMKTRQTKYGAYVTAYVLIILAVIFVANWLAKDHNKTVDVTANKRFTLSEQTKKVVGGLNKPVQVYYFDKSDAYERARDVMDRYKNLSPKFQVNYVDPDKKPDVARVEGMHAFGDIILDSGAKKETAK